MNLHRSWTILTIISVLKVFTLYLLWSKNIPNLKRLVCNYSSKVTVYDYFKNVSFHFYFNLTTFLIYFLSAWAGAGTWRTTHSSTRSEWSFSSSQSSKFSTGTFATQERFNLWQLNVSEKIQTFHNGHWDYRYFWVGAATVGVFFVTSWTTTAFITIRTEHTPRWFNLFTGK